MDRLSRFYAPEDLKRWRSIALGVGGIGTIVILGYALIAPDMREQALRSWLLGFIFWAGIGIGSLGILMIQSSRFSGPAIIFWCLIVSFAAVDWVMELDPHFSSTIWGMLFIVGWGLSSVCFVTIILAILSDMAPLNRVLGTRHFHDFGKL